MCSELFAVLVDSFALKISSIDQIICIIESFKLLKKLIYFVFLICILALL